MKNNNVKNPTIETHTEYNSYKPGDVIKGNVLIITERLLKIKSIMLIFYCQRGWKLIKKNKSFTDLSRFFKTDLDSALISYKTGDVICLNPDCYNIPFNLPIPQSLKPSFEYNSPKEEAYNRYKLDLLIKTSDKDEKCSKLIHIISPFMSIHPTEKVVEQGILLKSLLFNKGECRLYVSSEETCIKLNEPIKLNICINTETCSLTANKLKISLISKIEFFEKQQHDKHNQPVFISEKVLQERELKIDVNRSYKKIEEFLPIKPDNEPSEQIKRMYHFIKDCKDLFVSFQSDYIKQKYFVKVEVTCGKHQGPKTELPIYLITSDLKIEKNEINLLKYKQLGTTPSEENDDDYDIQKFDEICFS